MYYLTHFLNRLAMASTFAQAGDHASARHIFRHG